MTFGFIDRDADDRLLNGAVPADDEAPARAGLATMFEALRAPASVEEDAGYQNTIAAMGAVLEGQESDRGKSARSGKRFRGSFVALAAAAMLVMGTGLAFAGALPSGAQHLVAQTLHKFGVSIPDPSTHHGSPEASPSPSPSPSHGPDANGPAKFGLCTAYASGQGGVNGQKNNSTAFQNLQRAAATAGQSVDEFCAGATPGGKPAGGSPRGHGHPASQSAGSSHASTHRSSHPSPPPHGHGPGSGSNRPAA